MISVQLTQLTVQTTRTERTFYHEMCWVVIWLYRKTDSVPYQYRNARPSVHPSVCPKMQAK